MAISPDSKRDILDRLSAFTRSFREDFRRIDQARWLEIYLRDLVMRGLGKKSPRPSMKDDRSTQALHNFIAHSPWDESKLWRRFWSRMTSQLAFSEGVFVIDDIVFPKQGRHSVGVQRQYSAEHHRKINCQVAIGVYYFGRGRVCPLSLRLYLPRSWTRDESRLEITGVPSAFRRFRTKGQIALELLEDLIAQGWTGRYVVAGPTYGGCSVFAQWLERSSFDYLVGVPEGFDILAWLPAADTSATSPFLVEVSDRTSKSSIVSGWSWMPAPAERRFSDQNIVPSVTKGILIEKTEHETRIALGRLRAEANLPAIVDLWECRARAGRECKRLKEGVGLDRFEGRAWRGFHHHACLAMLAHGFLDELAME